MVGLMGYQQPAKRCWDVGMVCTPPGRGSACFAVVDAGSAVTVDYVSLQTATI